jgi:hypothetical protein
MFQTLEDLADGTELIDISTFGEKTDGLVTLLRAKTWPDFPGVDYVVQPGFVVPRNANLEVGDNLELSYATLLEGQKEKCGVLARSSSDDEQPGKFETKMVVYDPSNIQESLARLKKAVTLVQDGNSKAVIVQKMSGPTVYLHTEQNILAEVALGDESIDFDELAEELQSKIGHSEAYEIYFTFEGSNGQYHSTIHDRDTDLIIPDRLRDIF